MFSSKRDRSRSLSPSSFLSALIEEEDADQKKTGFPVPNKRRKLLPSSSSPPETVAADTSIPPAGAATTITAAAAHRENDKDNDKDKGEREKSERIKSEKGKEKQKDLLSPLSDEILLRILAFLSPPGLLALAPVSHRFYALTCDSQLWKGLYYDSFVRPRALRIPGFRNGVGSSTTTTATTSSIKTSSTTTAAATTIPGTAGFKAGGGVTTTTGFGFGFGGGESFAGGFARGTTNGNEGQTIDWKKQYKVRHKWAWGRCTAWSLNLGDKDEDEEEDQEEEDEEGKVEGENRGKVKRRTLIKIAGTTVITADAGKGLCAWDSSNVREGELLARVDLGREGAGTVPSCISVDQTVGPDKEVVVDIALGFTDGGFGIWRLFTRNKKLVRRYRHEGSSTNAELAEVAYSHPFLVTATGSVLVSLYTFDVPKPGEEEVGQKVKGTGILAEYADSDDEDGQDDPNQDDGRGELPPPYLLTSLRSHTSRPPLALSIRKTVFTTIASIAYTFSTLQGWAIGVQDLHIRKGTRSTKSLPEVITSRIAYTTPMASGRASHPRLATPPPTPRRQESLAGEGSTGGGSSKSTEPGPTCLRYTHPYLLATLPDNTLILYMCTSNATSLSISPGIRLWGHTSGISDAQITRRGKVVSVSSRGGEMRAWELEGASRYGSRRSVEIRPELPPAQGNSGTLVAGATTHHEDAGDVVGFDEWKKSVGFTDEMLIVLDERNSRGRATMMVYDFR